MAVEIVSGDTIRVRVGSYTPSQAAINTLHYQIHGNEEGSTYADLAGYLDGLFAPLWKAAMSGGASYYGVSTARIKPTPVTISFISTANPGAGTFGTEPLPQQVSGIISSYTDYGGPKWRGRIYIPFPDVTASDPVTNTPELLYNERLNAIGEVVYNPIIWDTAEAGEWLLTPVVFHRDGTVDTTIEGYRTKDRWGTQRSRSSSGRTNAPPPL